jgi:mono/diheme cytochrome c family protein
MPAFGSSLGDAEIAAVLTHIRSTWGNAAAPIDAEVVAAARARLADRKQPFSGGEELATLP